MKASGGYALFDLDHTLLPYDTQLLFCAFVLRREWWRRGYLVLFLPCVPLALLGVIGLRTMKRLFSSYLWRMPEATLRRHVREFAELVVRDCAYEMVVEEVRRHRDGGRTTILNSASPGFYVEEIARRLEFDYFVATDLIVRDPMPLIPEIAWANNKNDAKIAAMRKLGLLPDSFDESEGHPLPDSWGYSDSSADLPLLSICENGVMIHPGKRFSAIGATRGWSVLLPERPYRGRWGARLASVRQALGLWPI